MNEKYHRFHQSLYLCIEIILLIGGIVFAIYARFNGDWSRLQSETLHRFGFIFIITWFLSGMISGIYNTNRLIKTGTRIVRLFQALFIHILLFSFAILLFKKSISRELIYLTFSFTFIPIFIFRMLFNQVIRWLRKRGLNVKNFIVVGNTQRSLDVLNQMLKYPEYGYRWKGIFSDSNLSEIIAKENIIKDNYEASFNFIIKENIQEVYCTLPLSEKDKIQRIIRFCEDNFVRFKYVPDLEGVYGHKVNINFFESLPIITIRQEPLEILWNQIVKRIFDILFSLGVIIIIFPFLLIVLAPLILFESKGPLFYRQNRAGLNGKNFKIWKFRTMNVTESDTEFKQATKGDSRITKIGHILRKTNLDEMPQFFNVLLGNMSIVGPRPHVQQLNAKYSKIVDEYNIRLLVKPGLTGHAQINGYRGETKTLEQMKGRIDLDVWYLENWSILLDIRIVFKTVINMIRGEENAG